MENKRIIAETERLILRRYEKEDVRDLFEYLSDKDILEQDREKIEHKIKFIESNGAC